MRTWQAYGFTQRALQIGRLTIIMLHVPLTFELACGLGPLVLRYRTRAVILALKP